MSEQTGPDEQGEHYFSADPSVAFERIPATLAFRTTNKVGAVVVLAETVALVLAWRAWQGRARRRGRPPINIGIESPSQKEGPASAMSRPNLAGIARRRSCR